MHLVIALDDWKICSLAINPDPRLENMGWFIFLESGLPLNAFVPLIRMPHGSCTT